MNFDFRNYGTETNEFSGIWTCQRKTLEEQNPFDPGFDFSPLSTKIFKEIDDKWEKEKDMRNKYQAYVPKKVIFNNPATIIIWMDGTKTVVKCGENDIYDPEKGLALCYMKKICGNKSGIFNKVRKKWLKNEEEIAEKVADKYIEIGLS